MRRPLLALLVLAAGCASRGASPAARCADAPGVRCIVAGPHYAANPALRWLLGDDWRDVWTTPAPIPILDLAGTAGGLSPVRVVGNFQSQGLALAGGDGRSYTFRSTDKDASRHLGAPLRWVPLLARAYRDQTAAAHPAAPVVAAPIARAAGVLQPEPRLVVLPDDPRLGEFQARFAGRLGTFEEYPTPSADGGAGSFGAREIVSTEELIERLERDPAERVDGAAYLRARLVDLVLGDVDRHPGNWRWARLARGGRWLPVAEDRDLAFARFEGLLVGAARPVYPILASYDAEFEIARLAHQARATDPRLLAPLPREAWREAAAAVQAALPARVVAEAVARMPAPWFEQGGPELEALLRARIEQLGDAADAFYLRLAAEPEIHATAAREEVSLRIADGDAVDVTVRAEGIAEPVFERRFLSPETESVRLCGFVPPDRVTVEVAAAVASRPAFEVLEHCEPARPIAPPGAESADAGEDGD
jgi:hypothetical protein